MMEQIAMFLRVVGLAAEAGGVSNAATVARFTQIGASIIEAGINIERELKVLTNQIQVMVDEDRDPTATEWADLRARSNAAAAIIDSWEPGAS